MDRHSDHLVGRDVTLRLPVYFHRVIFDLSFHGLLAEKVEEQVTGEAIQSESSVVQVALSVPRGFLRELQKLFHYLPMALLVIIISVIPGLNFAAPFLWIILGAWMMSLQFIDYPMDNHRLPFRKYARPAVRGGERRSGLVSLLRLYREFRYSTSHSFLQRWRALPCYGAMSSVTYVKKTRANQQPIDNE